MKKEAIYRVPRFKDVIAIDGLWDKPAWENIREIKISGHMGERPVFFPDARAKMMYNDENLFVIFRVNDRFVRCITKDFNGPVWEDACVEFFFSPDIKFPLRYFNLEINCGGTPLMHYSIIPKKETVHILTDDMQKIEIAHSLPKIIDPEMKEPVTWTIEYRIPLAMLEKYSVVTHPARGVIWKANFYKIAENNSNPHYLTWSFVDNVKPDFHLPAFFGTIAFE